MQGNKTIPWGKGGAMVVTRVFYSRGTSMQGRDLLAFGGMPSNRRQGLSNKNELTKLSVVYWQNVTEL